MKLAVYPVGCDAVSRGHLDIIVRASRIFDQLIVGVPTNPEKHASFTVEERMELLRRATQAEGLRNVEIDKVDGLLADYAKRRGAMAVSYTHLDVYKRQRKSRRTGPRCTICMWLRTTWAG